MDCTSPNKQFEKLRAKQNNKELENLNKILDQEVHLTKWFESSNRICKSYVDQTETRVNNIKQKIKRIEDMIYRIRRCTVLPLLNPPVSLAKS